MSAAVGPTPEGLPRSLSRLSRNGSLRRSWAGSQYRRYTISSAHSESTEHLAATYTDIPLEEDLGPRNQNQPEEPPYSSGTIREQPQDHLETQDAASDGGQQDAPQLQTNRPTGVRWFLMVCAILINTFVYAVDNTIVAIIQPAIVEQYGDLTDLPWVSVGFIMAGTATALPMSGLYGVFDSKWLYIISTVIFAGASGLCGGAPTMPALIVGRVLAGLGGNGMYLGSLTMLSVFTEPAQTAAYIGYIGLSWGAGTVIGPILGGAFVSSSAGWRWSFYINLIICAISLPPVMILTPSFRPRPLDASILTSLRGIDWYGAATSLPAFMFIIMAISFGGTQFPWDGAATVSFFWASGFLFVMFWVQQYSLFKTSFATRLFPIHFFTRRDPLLIFIIQASAGGVVVVPLYTMALFYPFAQGDTALQAGVKLLPLVSFLVVMIVLNGHLMSIWGHHQVWIVCGSVMVLISGVFLARLTPTTSNATLYGLQVLLGIGTGAFSQAGFAIAQAMVEPAEIQNAISFMLIAQLSGTSLGLSLCGAIFQNRSTPLVAAALGPGFTTEQVVRIVSNIDPALTASLSAEQRSQVLDIIVQAIDDTFSLLYVAGAVCLLCGIFLTPNRYLLGRRPEKGSIAHAGTEKQRSAGTSTELSTTVYSETPKRSPQTSRRPTASSDPGGPLTIGARVERTSPPMPAPPRPPRSPTRMPTATRRQYYPPPAHGRSISREIAIMEEETGQTNLSEVLLEELIARWYNRV